MSLDQRLSALLRQKQLSGRDLARQMGYAESTVSKWLNGHLVPSMDALITLCETLNVSADWLIWGTELTHQPAAITTTPAWEAVDTTFSTQSTTFPDFIAPAKSLFFTSIWLTRAFDANNPVLFRLVEQGIHMRFVFPELVISLRRFDTNGQESPEQRERKKLNIMDTLYVLKQWAKLAPVAVRLTTAHPVNNLLAINYDTDAGRILYIPYLYGDFEHGPRPGFIIDQQRHPDWYHEFRSRYVVHMWEQARPISDLDALIEQIKSWDA
ncbi:MAG: helix-turn-helix transcriptional regulator [Anaerolineae bacterium]|nr:helix-turn-helix transcriptional regulator [Anaerolineae bacterium]